MINNKIYIVCKITDDTVNIDQRAFDDGIEINLNPNCVSGEYWNTIYKWMFFNIFHVSIPATNNRNDVYLNYGPQWFLRNTDYFQFANKIEKLPDGKNVVTYEISLQPFIDLSLYSRTLSSAYHLKSNQVLGLTIVFNDVDFNNNERDAQLRTVSGSSLWQRAEEVSFYILDPPRKINSTYDELLFFISN